MNFYAFSGLLTFITSVGFGIFSWAKGTKRLNKIWAVFCFCVAVWGLGCFKFSSVFNTGQVFFWLRIGHVGVILMPAFFLHFVLEFLELRKSRILLSIYAFGIFFSVVNLTDALNHTNLLIAHLRFVFNEFYVDSPPAQLYPIFLCYYFGTIIYAHYCAFKQYRNSSALKKNQMKYFLAATVLGFSGGATSFFMVFGVDIYPTLHITVPLYPIIMTYAVVNYKLMDIEVIIKRTLVFAGIVAAAVGVVSLPIALIQLFIGRSLGITPLWLMISGIATTVLIYRPLAKKLEDLTDRYLFQKKINYRILLKEATEYLAHLDSLKWQARRIIAFLLLKARITNACIYSFHSYAPGSLLLQASRPKIKAEGHKIIVLSHPLIQYMKARHGAVELRLLEEAKASEKDPEKIKALDQMIGLFKEHKAEAAIPCFGSGAAERARHTELHLRGILFLGHQKSDEPYTEEDLDVLFTLGQESSIAFENARLYDEAIERAQELGRTNQQLNDAQTRLMQALSEAELANERLRVTQAALIVAEKNATMVGMAKAIGHEVNNPLSTVDGRAKWIYKDLVTSCREILDRYSSVIEEDDFKKLVKSLSNIDDHAQRISHSAKRIEYVVKTLTNILKDTKGEMGPLSLTVMCHEAIEATRFQTYDENLSGCSVDLDIVANVMVRGNLEQLLQVLVNLIKNAYEAMGKQKERSITIRGYGDPEDSKMARIEVSDNGPGIPSGILPKIWTQGFSTKAKTGDGIGAHGQGQGLFVCKHMIESIHGGLIYAESTMGKGTTFVVKLPLASD